jgi:hypothetical protein
MSDRKKIEIMDKFVKKALFDEILTGPELRELETHIENVEKTGEKNSMGVLYFAFIKNYIMNDGKLGLNYGEKCIRMLIYLNIHKLYSRETFNGLATDATAVMYESSGRSPEMLQKITMLMQILKEKK